MRYVKQSYTLLWVVASVILGIAVAEVLWLRMPAFVWLAMTITALLPACLTGRYRMVQSFLLLVCFFCVGGWLCTLRIERGMVAMPAERVTYDAIVTATPNDSICELSVVCIYGYEAPLPLKVRAKMGCGSKLKVGDGLVAESRLYGIHRPRGEEDFFPRYLLCHGFAASTRIYGGKWKRCRLSTARLGLAQRFTLSCRIMRDRLLSLASRTNLTDDTRALLYAMTVGERSGLTASLRGDFSRSGVSHVLALSGLHFGMVYAVILFFLYPWRRRFTVRILFLVAIWLYAFFVGLSPSVLRSSLMLTAYSLLAIDYREHASVSILSFVALVLLLVNPMGLFDVGFQLSFASVLSILLFYPQFVRLLPERYIPTHPLLGRMASVGFLSLAAQLGTAPLVAYHFGTFSVYFLLANYVVIPLVTVIVPLGILFFLTLGLACFNGWVAWLLGCLLSWLVGFVHFVQSLPFASVTGLRPPVWMVVAIYMLLMVAYLLALRIKKRQHPK